MATPKKCSFWRKFGKDGGYTPVAEGFSAPRPLYWIFLNKKMGKDGNNK